MNSQAGRSPLVYLGYKKMTDMWPLSKINNARIEDLPVKAHMPQQAVDRIAEDVGKLVDQQVMVNVASILTPEAHERAMREYQSRQSRCMPAYHEFERPKNEAAFLQAAGDYMRKLLDIVWTGTKYSSIRHRSQELARGLIELSQQPLRFPAVELTARTVETVPGYDACSDVTKALIRELINRDEHGRKKYGVNLDRDDLSLEQWLQHQKEELLDGAGYAEAALRKIRNG